MPNSRIMLPFHVAANVDLYVVLIYDKKQRPRWNNDIYWVWSIRWHGGDDIVRSFRLCLEDMDWDSDCTDDCVKSLTTLTSDIFSPSTRPKLSWVSRPSWSNHHHLFSSSPLLSWKKTSPPDRHYYFTNRNRDRESQKSTQFLHFSYRKLRSSLTRCLLSVPQKFLS